MFTPTTLPFHLHLNVCMTVSQTVPNILKVYDSDSVRTQQIQSSKT